MTNAHERFMQIAMEGRAERSLADRFDSRLAGQSGVVLDLRDPGIERLTVCSASAAVLEHCQADLAAHARQGDALRGLWQFRSPPESARDSIRYVEPSSDLRLGESFIARCRRGVSGPISGRWPADGTRRRMWTRWPRRKRRGVECGEGSSLLHGTGAGAIA